MKYNKDQIQKIKLHRGMLLFYIACALVLLLTFGLMTFRMVLQSKIAARLDAIRAAGYPGSLSELNDAYPKVPAAENAAELYQQAFDHFHATDDIIFRDRPKKPAKASSIVKPNNKNPAKLIIPKKKFYELLPFVGIYNGEVLGEKLPPVIETASRRFITGNQDYIKRLKLATQRTRCRFPVNLTNGDATDLEHLNPLRNSIRVLKLAIFLAAETGDKQQSVEYILTQLKIAHALDAEPVYISQLVKNSLILLAITSIEQTFSLVELDETSLIKLATALKTHLVARNIRIKSIIAARQLFLLDLNSIVEESAKEYDNGIRSRYAIANLSGATAYYRLTILNLYKDFLTVDPNNIHAIKRCAVKNKKYMQQLDLFYDFLSFAKYCAPYYEPTRIFYHNLKVITKLKNRFSCHCT